MVGNLNNLVDELTAQPQEQRAQQAIHTIAQQMQQSSDKDTVQQGQTLQRNEGRLAGCINGRQQGG
jgi:hypothetical protein